MDSYLYRPLDLESAAFRLLILHKGSGPEIQCSIFQAYLDSDALIPYEALSYTWGGNDLSWSIIVDGKTLNITQNLYFALQELRSQEIDRTVWIDAICIDQGNDKERGHQVQQMRKIYGHADQVIFWLGEPNFHTDLILESLKLVEKFSMEFPIKDWTMDDERWRALWTSVKPFMRNEEDRYLEWLHTEGLKDLLKRPWFKRVWILQEVANAKSARVYCGGQSVSARIFAVAPFILRLKPEPHCQAVLDIMPGASRKYSWWNQQRDLYTLLLKFAQSEATDRRDKIYALLGICSGTRDSDYLLPDYTKTMEEVMDDTAAFLFGMASNSPSRVQSFSRDLASLNIKYLIDFANCSFDDHVAETFTWLETFASHQRNDWFKPEEMMQDLIRCAVFACGNYGAKWTQNAVAIVLKQPEYFIKVAQGVAHQISCHEPETRNLNFGIFGTNIRVVSPSSEIVSPRSIDALLGMLLMGDRSVLWRLERQSGDLLEVIESLKARFEIGRTLRIARKSNDMREYHELFKLTSRLLEESSRLIAHHLSE